MPTSSNRFTELLQLADSGDDDALNEILPTVYDQLRRLAQQRLAVERADHTLQATELVHEVCITNICLWPWKDRQSQPGLNLAHRDAIEAMPCR